MSPMILPLSQTTNLEIWPFCEIADPSHEVQKQFVGSITVAATVQVFLCECNGLIFHLENWDASDCLTPSKKYDKHFTEYSIHWVQDLSCRYACRRHQSQSRDATWYCRWWIPSVVTPVNIVCAIITWSPSTVVVIEAVMLVSFITSFSIIVIISK